MQRPGERGEQEARRDHASRSPARRARAGPQKRCSRLYSGTARGCSWPFSSPAPEAEEEGEVGSHHERCDPPVAAVRGARARRRSARAGSRSARRTAGATRAGGAEMWMWCAWPSVCSSSELANSVSQSMANSVSCVKSPGMPRAEGPLPTRRTHSAERHHMSLATADGPLSAHPADSNYDDRRPCSPDLLRAVHAPRARRARRRDRDRHARRPAAARDRHPPPAVRADRRRARRRCSSRASGRRYCPFKGDASYRSLRVGDRRRAGRAVALRASDRRPPPWLEHYAGVYEDRFDRWLDEDDEVVGTSPIPSTASTSGARAGPSA